MDASSDTSPQDRERQRLSQFPDKKQSGVRHPGVLLANEIQRCCEEFSLISPFSPHQLKAASYRLTVGHKFGLAGRRDTLAESQEITIPPFQVSVIQTRETLNLPRDMIARWNIKVSRAYEGLIWAGGPQVDPGYQGYLFCPIYNLSNKPVTLAYGAEIAVIDFVTTTTFDDSIKQIFPRPPSSLLFEDYPTLQSGLADAWDLIKRFESQIQRTDTKVTVYGGLAVTLIGIIIAALSIIVSANTQIRSLRSSEWLCLIISGLAMALSTWVWILVRSRPKPKQEGIDVASSLVMILVGIFLGAVAMFFALALTSR